MGLFGPPNIEKMKQKGHVIGLIKALCYERDPEVRCEAAAALGTLKDVRAVDPLVGALMDNDYRIRAAAAEALGRLKNARAVDPLTAVLEDKHDEVRQTAFAALGRIGKPAVESLIAVLMGPRRYDNYRHAVQVLGKIGNSRAVEPLTVALKDNHSDVRAAAVEALDKIGWQPGRDETGAMYWTVKNNWEACARYDAPRAIELLIAALDNKDFDTRKNAALALVSLYTSGNLDETSKDLILVRRNEIKGLHEDSYEHSDAPNGMGESYSFHTDHAAVEFPL